MDDKQWQCFRVDPYGKPQGPFEAWDCLGGCSSGWCAMWGRVRPNVRAKRATTAGRQARAGENVPRTARPGLVACRWRSA